MEVSAQQLAASSRCSVEAPAGCGKTYLIGAAVASSQSGRQLVLTHTHAGVDALRATLRRLGVASARCSVQTIAGWSLWYSAAFPRLSGLTPQNPVSADWRVVYEACTKLLTSVTVKDVLRSSYDGIYVDEYQDCTSAQHQVILRLADLLPCRALGDPLQSIFGFSGQEVVSWAGDVIPAFPPLGTLYRKSVV